jgi:serine/threonine protein phosphatase PrpC
MTRRLTLFRRRNGATLPTVGPHPQVAVDWQTGIDAAPPLDAIKQSNYPGRIIVDRPTVDFEPHVASVEGSQSGLFRPDTVVDGWSTKDLCVRAATTRGDAHRLEGSPRQDDFALTHHAGTGSVVIAVADGVSSARDSHFGASAVCRYALSTVRDAMDLDHEPDWTELVKGAAWTLVELARHRLGETAEPHVAQRLFATTLTVALIVPTGSHTSKVSGVCVGDSAAWLLRASELSRIGGGKSAQSPDEPFSSLVAALPAVPSSLNIFESELLTGDALLVMSDGVGDPLGDGTGLLGDLLRHQLKLPPPLLQMARIADFSRETFNDDRTLAAIWQLDGGTFGHGPGS